MYDPTLLKSGLIGLIGWRQNVDISGWQLLDLITSTSDLWYNDYHALMTLDNIISIAPDFDSIFPVVADRNDAFTDWLQAKTESGIIKAVESWLNEKSELRTANSLLARNDLFDNAGNIFDTEPMLGRMVGIEITPARSKNVIPTIEGFTVQLDTNQTFDVYLFRSGTLAPIQTKSVIYTGAGSVQSVAVTWPLTGQGSYYLAYDDSLLTGNVINGTKEYNYRNRGLTTFPTGRFYSATAFDANVPGTSTLWDLTATNYSISTNYGLNVSMSVRCDYTAFIIEQKDLFKTAIALQVTMDMLREMAFNPNSRINRNEANISRAELMFDIDGDTQGSNEFSVFGQLKKALKAIHFDMSGIDKVCLPCRKRSVTYKAVGPSWVRY